MAVVDFFLKVDGIDGESLDKKHAKEIQIDSFSWGASQGGTSSLGSGAGSGKVRFHDFHFVMKVNSASPKLFLACANGEHIKKVVLTCRKAGKDPQEYLTWEFTDCLVSSFQTGGTGTSDVLPTDQISINFAQAKQSYKPQKADGTLGAAVMAGWNIQTGGNAS